MCRGICQQTREDVFGCTGEWITIIRCVINIVNFSPNACTAITRSLSPGSTGGDVETVQQFLITPRGCSRTGFSHRDFSDHSRKRAVESWRKSAQGIVSSGDPASTGYGAVGPRTRLAAIAAACTKTSTLAVSAPLPPRPSRAYKRRRPV